MLSGRAWFSAVVTGTFCPLLVPIFKDTFQIKVVKVIKGSKNMPSNYPKRGITVNLHVKKECLQMGLDLHNKKTVCNG